MAQLREREYTVVITWDSGATESRVFSARMFNEAAKKAFEWITDNAYVAFTKFEIIGPPREME